MRDDADTSVRYQAASDGLLRGDAGCASLSGRTFDATRDVRDRPLVVLINDAAARRPLPRGRCRRRPRVDLRRATREVVGVVRGVARPADHRPGSSPACGFRSARSSSSTCSSPCGSTAPRPTARLDAVRAASPASRSGAADQRRADDGGTRGDGACQPATRAAAVPGASRRSRCCSPRRVCTGCSPTSCTSAARNSASALPSAPRGPTWRVSCCATAWRWRWPARLACLLVLPVASGGWLAWTDGLGRARRVGLDWRARGAARHRPRRQPRARHGSASRQVDGAALRED